LGKTDGDRGGSTVTMVLTGAYLALLFSCLWVALVERDGWVNECRQHSYDCKTVASSGPK
jgi:hypothetical protein